MSDNEAFSDALEVIDAASTQVMASDRGMVQMRSTFMTAVKCEQPRQLARVQKQMKEEARLAGETFFYGWGAGKDRIEGKSQALAHAALRAWGNCAVEFGPIQELADSWIFTAYFIDLESGTTIARPFRMSKSWKVYGKFDEARKDDIRFQIGASKAARNVILKGIPQWLTDQAIEAAKDGVRARIASFIERKGLAAAQDAAMSRLLKSGVSRDAVMARFGIAEPSALDLDKLVMIQGDLKAIDDGEARPGDLYPASAGPVKSDFEESPGAAAVEQAEPEKGKAKPAASPETASEPKPLVASERRRYEADLLKEGMLESFAEEHGTPAEWTSATVPLIVAALDRAKGVKP
jgi:hypothetical protein